MLNVFRFAEQVDRRLMEDSALARRRRGRSNVRVDQPAVQFDSGKHGCSPRVWRRSGTPDDHGHPGCRPTAASLNLSLPRVDPALWRGTALG